MRIDFEKLGAEMLKRKARLKPMACLGSRRQANREQS